MKKSFKLTGIVVALLLLSSHAFAFEKTVRWKLAMSWPSTLSPLADASFKVAKLVKEMSGGKFIIKVEGSEKTKSPLGVFDMVRGGAFQMGSTASYYYLGKDINAMWFTTVPWGMTKDEQYAWFYYGNGMKLMQEVYGKYGMLSFPCGNTGVQMGGWFRKEIKTVDDLKGLKMRIPGFAGKVMAKLGVSVVNIPGGELYTSLDRGTIDALEWVGPGMDVRMGFYKVAPYYYTGWHEPASEMNYVVNKKAFEKLPKKYQVMLVTAMQAATADVTTAMFNDNANGWAKMKKENPNIKVKTFPVPVLKAMKKATDELLSSYAAKNPMFKKIWDDQKAFMKKAREWSMMSEYHYLKASQEVK
ncbi:TRAP transporter substrate-binding protein [Sulfurospirillum sp. 1612]|uniref:TRAP transporter substrate-binding protein n=1 Tax=Sulfurospirillum sp. 1612 TaxID=3094835 RepID=UPI002F956585